MGDLRSEYQYKYWVYNKESIRKQQAEYRKTDEGKLALRRAKERQILKRMNGRIKCNECDETQFEVLNVYDEWTLCYNCRYKRPIVFSEEEKCQ